MEVLFNYLIYYYYHYYFSILLLLSLKEAQKTFLSLRKS